jgi:hypothetical protein
MLFPKDRTIYANLNTSFTAFDALLADLAFKRTTGHVDVTFPGYQGALLLGGGEIVQAVEMVDGEKVTGPSAAHHIIARAGEKNGSITVYSLAPEIVALIQRVIDARPLYRDLTSAFVSLERLIAKLRSDGLTGYVEVSVAEGQGMGIIFLSAGEPVECVFQGSGDATTGNQALETIVQSVTNVGGSFNVFVEAGAPAAAGAAVPAPAARDDALRDELIAFWEDVISRTEALADGLSKPGRFLLAFKEVLVSRAVTYPFLDPFAADFQYAGGHITFEGPLPDDLSKSLGDCLSDTVAKLAFQLKRADFESRVRAQLAGVSEAHAAVIDRLGLGDDVQEWVA